MSFLHPGAGGGSGSTRQLRISAWAIRNPTPVAVIFIALIIAGLLSYFTLPIKNYPDVEFPVVIVTGTQSGAAPSQLKTQVTRPIEDALSGVADVQTIASNISQGVSSTRVQFNLGTNMITATDDVRAKIDSVRSQLPREIDPPTVSRFDFEDQPIIYYAVSPAPGVTMSDSQVSWIVDNDISRALQGVNGVGQVARVGGVDRGLDGHRPGELLGRASAARRLEDRWIVTHRARGRRRDHPRRRRRLGNGRGDLRRLVLAVARRDRRGLGRRARRRGGRDGEALGVALLVEPVRRAPAQRALHDLLAACVEPRELDAHAVRLGRHGRIELARPLHQPLAANQRGGLGVGEHELELDRRADRLGRLGGDEDAAARDVHRVLLDEGLEVGILQLDAHRQRSAIAAAIVLTRHRAILS